MQSVRNSRAMNLWMIRVLGVFLMGMFGMLASGTSYGFSAWSPAIKKSMQWDQSDIEFVGELGNVGTYLGPISGIMASMLPIWFNCLISSIFCFLGYFFASEAVRDISGFSSFRNPYALGFAFCLVGFGSGLLYALILNVQVHNIPSSKRAISVALLVSLFGISASIFTAIYNQFGDAKLDDFLFFLASCLGIIALLCAAVLRYIDAPSPAQYINSSESLRSTSTTALIDGERDDIMDIKNTNNSNEYRIMNPGLVEDEDVDNEVDVRPRDLKSACTRVFAVLLFLARSSMFWLLFIAFFLVAGAGLFYINNAGHIAQALNNDVDDHEFTLKLVLALSLANGAGRLFMAISDFVAIKRGYFLVLSALLMCVAHFINGFVLTTKSMMFPGAVMVGLAYGLLWASIPVIISEKWGQRDFAMSFGWMGVAPGIASILFNSIAGSLYQRHVPQGETDCVGTDCFRDVFIVVAIGSGVASLLALKAASQTEIGRKSKDTVVLTAAGSPPLLPLNAPMH